MAYNYSEKKNDYKTSVMNPQPNVRSSHEQEGAQNQEGSRRNIWPQSTSSQGESSTRKKTKEGSDELSFKLFKFPNEDEGYLLQMHEVKAGRVKRRHVQVYQNNGKWKVRVYDFGPGNNDGFPVLEDPTPLVFQKKYDLSLQERLVGWTMEKRKWRNGKEDKFYYHRQRQFRSFVELTAYILYSCNLKDLKLASTTNTSHEAKEAEAVQAMMIISSSGAGTSMGLGAGKED